MYNNSIVNHEKNKIYKQFQDSIYGKATVPVGYDLLFDYDNHESGFVGKVYFKGNHIVVVPKEQMFQVGPIGRMILRLH